ncbi:DoxX family protein OS=Tsukamurella paurometabola (strain ATCC 8368 / DSM / CCUG 35730 / CIP 100753 / JCM 10117 / KCTC 9821 / NBRC 16120 / NCIMB 702349/ NCTC 13040) OX=521096 GN=Tpau_3262 PE=3 SV=1 [Tsukamurella paurometabola]|uniref:DoxX family protein n=1 Tax=Tsukamurella paurometabola (strain ATCC 8368 / DSM 20162 / CCUG 35730 / CIP 100753 / JCM 10117 / KCTC 9821 / NBRC 16120 / NCIMB 702349 / NCTC 13040) TaxID=521096 RepID=D5UVR5_TSUPD|nr:DoxX family protein [Tsukamurella paurometabola]ADG79847.1 DoxX family protein [Tsukamurella paurometabola DSM 20162]SUP37412.1 DoxX [Tsukamurella paurometabola]
MLKKLVATQFTLLTLARVILGITFFAHGWQKVVTNGLGATATGFEKTGVPAPTLSAWFAGLAELLGGALLIVGLAVPLVALVLIIDMLGAIFTVHIDNGFFAQGGGIELPLVLIAGLLAVAAVPQTSLGVDALVLKKKLEGAK